MYCQILIATIERNVQQPAKAVDIVRFGTRWGGGGGGGGGGGVGGGGAGLG